VVAPAARVLTGSRGQPLLMIRTGVNGHAGTIYGAQQHPRAVHAASLRRRAVQPAGSQTPQGWARRVLNGGTVHTTVCERVASELGASPWYEGRCVTFLGPLRCFRIPESFAHSTHVHGRHCCSYHQVHGLQNHAHAARSTNEEPVRFTVWVGRTVKSHLVHGWSHCLSVAVHWGCRQRPRAERARVWRQSRVMDEDDGPLGRDWLGEISEMLVNGGYFRARMTSISPFDKVHPPR
jgi:hypothetical protein